MKFEWFFKGNNFTKSSITLAFATAATYLAILLIIIAVLNFSPSGLFFDPVTKKPTSLANLSVILSIATPLLAVFATAAIAFKKSDKNFKAFLAGLGLLTAALTGYCWLFQNDLGFGITSILYVYLFPTAGTVTGLIGAHFNKKNKQSLKMPALASAANLGLLIIVVAMNTVVLNGLSIPS